jgi:chromate transporter
MDSLKERKNINENGEYQPLNPDGGYLNGEEINYFPGRRNSLNLGELLLDDGDKYDEPYIENFHEELMLTKTSIWHMSFWLGCISFGGPNDHQDLIKEKFVEKNKYFTIKQFDHLLNLCLVLPGYSSSQFLSLICAIKNKSVFGGIISSIAFNLPSLVAILVISLILKLIKFQIYKDQITNDDLTQIKPNFAYFNINDHMWLFTLMILSSGICQGALALLIQAAFNLSKKVSNSNFQLGILISAAILYLIFHNFMFMVILLILGGIVSTFKGDHDYLFDQPNIEIDFKDIKFKGIPCLITFMVLFLTFYILDFSLHNIYIFTVECFLKIGALSFGEGHVIIPMILTEYSHDNLLEEAEILNGYTLVSLLPGPMFNVAGYVGVLTTSFLNGLIGGLLASFAIFIPGFLFAFTALPYINQIRKSHFFQFFIRGCNSAAIGFVYTAAFKLWIDSCFVNPYSNPVIGTLNIILCFVLADAFKIHKPFVIIFGAIFLILQAYAQYFLS